jgi:alginate O-acetyltransferase complex protein AlgJ
MSKRLPVSAIYLIGLLAICVVMSVTTFIVRGSEFSVGPVTMDRFLKGKLAAELEKQYEENMLIRDQAVGLWGVVQYGIFKSGGKKVIVGKENWLFSTEEFERHPNERQAEDCFLAIAGKVNSYLGERGIKLAVVIIPAKARIYEEHLTHPLPPSKKEVYGRVMAGLSASDIVAPDIAGVYASSNDISLYFKLDTHWTPTGAMIAARTLAESLNGYLTANVEFSRKVLPPEALEGDLEKYIKTGIFSTLFAPPKDMLERRRIEKTGGEDGGGLFGDETIPVILVGTSYSAIDKWNFEGELRKELKADVLNISKEGQGPLNPMAEFLKQGYADKEGVKLVVWEVPERFIGVTYDTVEFPEFIEEAR